MTISFARMHGCGNDFVVIDDLGKPEGLQYPITPELARKLLDRRFGIGGDQLLWLKPAKDGKHDARMDILNPDGSVAEMCGNGVRAAALYLETNPTATAATRSAHGCGFAHLRTGLASRPLARAKSRSRAASTTAARGRVP